MPIVIEHPTKICRSRGMTNYHNG